MECVLRRYKIHGHTNTLGILTKGPTQIVSTGAQITGAGGKLYAVSDSPVSAVQRIHAHAMHSDVVCATGGPSYVHYQHRMKCELISF